MINVEREIVNLILDNPCVIIPGLGGFVTSYIPSKVDENKGILTPPYTSFLFNNRLINDDGLLIHTISKKYNLDYKIYKILIENKVDEWKQRIYNFESVPFCGLGELRLNSENKITFISFSIQINDYKNFGLKNVYLTVYNENNQSIENNDFKDLKLEEHNYWNKTLKFVAAACLLPILFLSFWIPLKTDFLESGIIQLEELNPFYINKASEYKKEDIKVLKVFNTNDINNNLENDLKKLSNDVNIYSYCFDENLYIPVKINKNRTKNNIIDRKFVYVIGSFSNENNAKLLKNQLESYNFNTEISKYNSFYRVITKSKSDSLFNELVKMGFNPWELKN